MNHLKLDQRGMSLIAVIITGAIITISLMTIINMFASDRVFSTSQDRRVRTEQITSDVAAQLLDLTWGEVQALCKDKLAAPVDGTCIVSGKMNRPANTPRDVYCKDAPRRPLELARDMSGFCNPAGIICVELRQCKYLLPDTLLELELRGYWIQPKTDQSVGFRDQTVRKAAW